MRKLNRNKLAGSWISIQLGGAANEGSTAGETLENIPEGIPPPPERSAVGPGAAGGLYAGAGEGDGSNNNNNSSGDMTPTTSGGGGQSQRGVVCGMPYNYTSQDGQYTGQIDEDTGLPHGMGAWRGSDDDGEGSEEVLLQGEWSNGYLYSKPGAANNRLSSIDEHEGSDDDVAKQGGPSLKQQKTPQQPVMLNRKGQVSSSVIIPSGDEAVGAANIIGGTNGEFLLSVPAVIVFYVRERPLPEREMRIGNSTDGELWAFLSTSYVCLCKPTRSC